MITDKQVAIYRKHFASGKFTREGAAAKAATTPKTARKWESGPMPSEVKSRGGPRSWRTREDKFAGHWEAVILPELQADEDDLFEAKFLFEYLQEELPGQFPDSTLRTFQRRVTDYRALHGPPKEVIFPQVYRPGEKAQLDFTRIASLGVTLQGQPLNRMLFECVLCYSGQRHVAIVPSESYEALSMGVQGAFLRWGGVPVELWHDHLSAAIHNLKSEDRYEISKRYQDLIGQYGVLPRFIEVAKPNQNGCVERAHGVLKNMLRQALKLRRSCDFDSMEKFEAFLFAIVEKLNRKRQERWAEEQKCLRALPPTMPSTYSELTAPVSRWSLIQVKGNIYSVPARLIGHSVNVHVHLETLDIFYKDNLIETVPRLIGRGNKAINYRHMIRSLIRKPGAFANYRYRDQMFPTLTFRKAYDALCKSRPATADREYLQILYLAAQTMECDVEAALDLHLESGSLSCSQAVIDLIVTKAKPDRRMAAPSVPDLKSFNELLTGEFCEQLIAA